MNTPTPDGEQRDPDTPALIDPARSSDLDDVGSDGYRAALTVSWDGTVNLILARREFVGRPQHRYDATCPDAPHEQVGVLPIEFTRRLDRLTRIHARCGRPKKDGSPCRAPVGRHGAPCARHRAAHQTGRTEHP
jgi:hypothetical protein